METEYSLEIHFDDGISPSWTEVMDCVSIDRAQEIIKDLAVEDSTMLYYQFYETKEIELF